MSVVEAVKQAILPIIEASGIYLEEVTLTGGSPTTLTVIVDSDTHLNLDQVTVVTKQISEILESLPELGETPFTLEVSSPGIDRPLTLPRHWRKNQGRLTTIVLHNGNLVQGRIGDLSDADIAVDEKVIPLADIAKAHVEIEFKSLKKGDE
jgi:ribosome maturation factor RimP